MRKVVLVLMTIMVACSVVNSYYSLNKQESRAPIESRYNQSRVSRIIPFHYFQKVHSKLPGTASFILGLDPRASRLADVRWMIIVFVGWIYFSFLFPLPAWIAKLGCVELFILPPQIALVLSIAFPISRFVRYFDPVIAGRIDSSAFLMLKGLVVLVGIVSLFSVPGHIVLMIRREKFNSGKPMFGKEPAPDARPLVRRTEIDGVMYAI